MDNAASNTNAKTNASTSTNTDLHENDFQNTSRVGRRNALPDILNEDGTTITTDLPEKFSALTTNDPNESSANASKSETTATTVKSPSTQSSNS